MGHQLEGLNSIREYYLGKLDAYENAMKLVDPRFSGTIHGIIDDVKASIAFYDREIVKLKASIAFNDREIAKFKEELTSK